ncbi:hypothetical protein SCOR_04475 [Sulfidibacter corallicola]|uniref:Uncharacterized protein n=1 Tax=Sulfidibacter corallicola TaxID=2818388 RepID=A0A8A4TPS4_SULCO|nr:hypothetical protein [Sulfidibacter corallicola]QTD51969.1 hypothetical protein J3U87_05805 [Sulfidibacter corallicola]
MIEGINAALGGLHRATQTLNETSKQLAQGDLNEEVIVNSKIAQRNAEAQIVTIEALSEVEETALDLLA